MSADLPEIEMNLPSLLIILGKLNMRMFQQEATIASLRTMVNRQIDIINEKESLLVIERTKFEDAVNTGVNAGIKENLNL